jgi:transmembrane sensor
MTDPGDLMRRIARVGEEIDPALTDRDVDRLVSGARRRIRRRLVGGALIAGAASVALAAIVVRPLGPPGSRPSAPAAVTAPGVTAPPAPPAPPAMRDSQAPLRLADGSVATPLDEGSTIALRETTDRLVTVDLVRGRGRFDVTPRPNRRFSVRAGDVTITVLGTVFTVERVADRIGVNVERGRVLVDWGTGSRRLDVGERGWFPPLVVSERARPVVAQPSRRPEAGWRAGVPPQPAEPVPPTAASAEEPPAPSPLPASPPPGARPGETTEALLAAADAARLDRRPRDGAALLRRILTDHRRDPRAPLAAFTLGRVLLMDLGQAREAAAAFAEARALAPDGPFAEDALAREVEALAKAGDAAAASARARDYSRLFPAGRRAAAVRSFGGGE